MIVQILITWLVTSVSLFILSKLPLGVEIDSFNKALFSAAVFGILNALVRPVLAVLALPITFLTFGLFTIILNAIIFGLAAALVEGFRLRWGIWSAILGAMALGFINSVLFQLLSSR
ncbi:MAG: phage holin family protein [Oscillatoria princeps RMCB-10]|jgi:putative membrane protein|nr:phage holin family protein [Oscillatoria princeps RMCB-10]